MISFLAVGLLGLGAVPAASQSAPPPEPVVVHTDAAGLTLEWRAPVPSLHPVSGDDGRLYTAVEAPGWPQIDAPGQPRLPFAAALAVVPPTSDVILHVETLARGRRPLPHPVVPARTPAPVGDPPGRVEWMWARDERAYGGSGPHPADVVTLEEAGWLRGRRLVRLTYHPLRFDPARGALEVASRVRVELRFPIQPSDGAADAPAGESRWGPNDPFISVLQGGVVNPAQVVPFVRLGGAASTPAPLLRTQRSASASPGAAPDEITLSRTLTEPPGGADYLIIAHSDFVDAVAPLAAHRATVDGLRVFSTTVQSIYDAYSGGQVDPEAIKSYIHRAYHSWTSPALSYVLLVGDGTEDPVDRSHSADPHPNYVPPYLVDLWGEPAASDNRFVTVDGDDNMADVFIGRLPVNSAAETTTVVDKILAYELNPPQWPWNRRALFFAGNESDAPYHQYSDDVYHDHLPGPFSGRRVYFCTSGCDQPYLYDDIDAAHGATMRELNAGGLLVSYVGHSSWHQWAQDPETYAPMFHVRHVGSLHNGGALPVVLEMTCYTSRFAHPTDDTLDESLVRRAGGGAVATWGPTTWASTQGNEILHPEYFDAVFQDEITALGPATEAAKAHLPSYLSYLRDTFILLGDPALDLNLDIVPWADEVFLPMAVRSY